VPLLFLLKHADRQYLIFETVDKFNDVGSFIDRDKEIFFFVRFVNWVGYHYTKKKKILF
jgi:hypothetical protein